jgi:hypothetical protein
MSRKAGRQAVQFICVCVNHTTNQKCHLCIVRCAGADWWAGLKVEVELRVVVTGEAHGLAAVEVPGWKLLEPAGMQNHMVLHEDAQLVIAGRSE